MPEQAEFIVIPADIDASVRTVTVDPDSLDDVQGLVGGDFQQLYARASWSAIANESGMNEGLPLNPRAAYIMTMLAGYESGWEFFGDIALVGTKGDRLISVPNGLLGAVEAQL